jgi:hypothetical protein
MTILKYIFKFYIPFILLIITVIVILCNRMIIKESTGNHVNFNEEYFRKISSTEKEKYLDSIVTSLRDEKNDSVSRNLYLKASEEYYYLNNIRKSFTSSHSALKLSKEAKDSSRIAKSLYFIGDCYENSQKDSAYYYYLHTH